MNTYLLKNALTLYSD